LVKILKEDFTDDGGVGEDDVKVIVSII